MVLHSVAAAMLSAVVAQAQTQPQDPAATGPVPAARAEEEIIELSPFEVSAESDQGYVATQTLAGSRINTKLEDIGSAITVITSEFLKDTGAVDNKSLLMYTPNTEVGGMQGNFRGISGGQTESDSNLTNPNSNTRVRGLSSADNTRNFFMSNISWDGYNVDRIDMQRGANSILFGMGSPAGIINSTTKTAQHRTFGSVDFRYGSYGANRQALDYNQNLLKDELSIRVDLLRKDEQYKQDPAYSLDRRAYGALRYDPKFLNRGAHKTTLKVNYEKGSVRSNNPRTVAPIDCITPWWDELDQTVYNPNLVQNSGEFYNLDANGQPYYDTDGKTQINSYFPTNAGQYNRTRGTKSEANPTYEPWLGAPSMYGGVWAQVNTNQSVPFSYSQPEFANIGGLSSKGTVDGGIGGLPFSRRVTVATTAYMAERDLTVPYQKWGLWKSTSLTDSSVYDFYNNLIDGDNKNEWQDFNAFNASLSQTFFNQKLGFELAYDQQDYVSGQYSFSNGTVFVDINSHNLDGTLNENVGKAYTESSNTWGNGKNDVARESARFSAYGSHDFSERNRWGWVGKLLGKHTVSGLLSRDMWRSDNRSFKRYGTPDEFASLVSTSASGLNIDDNSRAVTTLVYLSDSLVGQSSYQGLNIGRAGDRVEMPETVQWKYFDSTWNAPATVDKAATWINPYNNSVSTQAENPANYVGWSTTDVKILSAENGDQDALTMGANLNRRKTESRALVWQGGFWDGAITGMYGIRHDAVRNWGVAGTKVRNRVNFDATNADGSLVYQATDKARASVYEANSPSWSVMAKLNKFVGDRLPINVSLYYNESQNFQIESARQDLYGNALAMPSGKTNERGIMLSTKDGKYFVRINKYETSLVNANNSTGIPTWFFTGQGNFIMRNEDRADAYEYHLTELGNPNSVADTGTTTGTWAWQYAPTSGQTQADADALSAAAVAAWRKYTQEPIVQKIIKAWGFNDFNNTQLTTMSTPVSNFVATEDQVSKGWEYEFVANPTKNWSVSFNASETKAMRSNIGGEALQEFVALTNEYQNGPMGQIRQWGGGGAGSTGINSWNGNFYSKYLLMKLQEGTYSTELRRWRFNFVTNYRFTEGKLKGFRVGGGYRWQDKVAIGYPVIDVNGDGSAISFDMANPYYGPRLDGIDLWIGYERKLTSKIDWDIQLNVYNVGDGNRLIPASTQYDGTVAAWTIAPCQTWSVTSSFRF